MARDNFPKNVIEQLRSRVAHRCSNPDCRVPTAAASSEATAVTIIGVAAHIHAASAGGPRYLAEMTGDERRSIENGIWLCATCAAKIDRDVLRYSAEVLRQWRKQAEEQSVFELGRPIPTAQDTSNQVAMAMTGLPTSFTWTAIENVHKAASQSLEALDPRFRVDSAYQERTTTFTLKAKEPVSLSVKIDEKHREEWRSQFLAMLDHGKEMRINAEAVAITGSPLLDRLLGVSNRMGGRFTVQQNGKPAVTKLRLVKDDAAEIISLDSIHGSIVGGKKSFTFNGSGCGGLLSFSFSAPTDKGLSVDAGFELSTAFGKWEERDIHDLPYFDSICDLYRRLTEGWELDIQLEMKGKTIIGGRSRIDRILPIIEATHNVLAYTQKARLLSSHLGCDIAFRLSQPFTADDHVSLDETVRILEGEGERTGEVVNNIRCTLISTAEGENIRALNALGEVVFVQPPEVPLMVFGQPIDLPDLRTTFSGAEVALLDDVSHLNEGDPVRVEWIPGKDFKLQRSFDLEDFLRSHEDEATDLR